MSAPIWDEAWLQANVWPRFSRALARKQIYLANHSLGRPPDRMAEDLRAAIDAWYRDLDHPWGLWLETRDKFPPFTPHPLASPPNNSITPHPIPAPAPPPAL